MVVYVCGYVQQRARLAVGSIFNVTLDDAHLQVIFAMDHDDVYDAAVDWLFTDGVNFAPPPPPTTTTTTTTTTATDSNNNTSTINTRVLSFTSLPSSDTDEPVGTETPDTIHKRDNLPQPSASKRAQSSFDQYCCICFMVRALAYSLTH